MQKTYFEDIEQTQNVKSKENKKVDNAKVQTCKAKRSSKNVL